MDTVRELADELGKSTKSIIGKLSREGVYKRSVYVSKTGEAPITKVELVSRIAYALELPDDKLEGLEKAPKQVLFTLCLLYTSPSPRDGLLSRMPSSA